MRNLRAARGSASVAACTPKGCATSGDASRFRELPRTACSTARRAAAYCANLAEICLPFLTPPRSLAKRAVFQLANDQSSYSNRAKQENLQFFQTQLTLRPLYQINESHICRFLIWIELKKTSFEIPEISSSTTVNNLLRFLACGRGLRERGTASAGCVSCT